MRPAVDFKDQRVLRVGIEARGINEPALYFETVGRRFPRKFLNSTQRPGCEQVVIEAGQARGLATTATGGDIRGPVVREFHVLGDTVNTAARLGALCKKVDRDFLVSWSLLRELLAERGARLS